MLLLGSLLLLGAASSACASAPDARLVNVLGAQGINLLRLARASSQSSHTLQDTASTQVQLSTNVAEFTPHWFEQPVDHFSNGSETFRQRYWINTRHYKAREGAPVIVIDGGETSGEDRLPFLDTGIAEILAKATGGIGVILEHRCAHLALV